ncbi:MAG: prepilin-type N-terminal cleavage/methylation domain-containing protein [Propionibacteriales bacterium]|nr:prepilin-type N-terminal cleavage/methylation domain-containing protein [Propionibacteriales bacterium]
MLARMRKSMEEKDQGFTLIELLVVMIIIGILAAIAIPVFLNQRKKAQDSAAKADVSTIGKELATYYVDGTGVPTLALTSGRYTLTPPGAGATAVDLGKASANVTLDAAVAGAGIVDDTHWCVAVTNAKGDVQDYKYSAKGGLSTGNCVAADVS